MTPWRPCRVRVPTGQTEVILTGPDRVLELRARAIPPAYLRRPIRFDPSRAGRRRDGGKRAGQAALRVSSRARSDPQGSPTWRGCDVACRRAVASFTERMGLTLFTPETNFLPNADAAAGADVKFLQRISDAELRKKTPVVIFVLSLMFWAFVYGVAVEKFRLFPFHIIRQAEEGAQETLALFTGKLPWYYQPTDRTETVVSHRPSAFSEGLTLVSGLTKEGNLEVKVLTRDGEALHRWRIDWFDGFWPDPSHIPAEDLPRKRPATIINGIALLKNGDLVVNLDLLGMVRVGLCGNVVWRLPYQTHHALHVDETENIWVAGQKRIRERAPDLPGYQPPFVEFTVLKVTPGGDIVREISIVEVLTKNKLHGLLYMSPKDTWSDNWSMEVSGDTLHLNAVELFPSHLQPGIFEAGDVMISLRNINAVMVFNPDTLHIKYLSIGKVVRQHDPHFVDGTSISIFDNNNVAPASHAPQSRIVVVDARNDHMHVRYAGSSEQPFYTGILGKHQWLPNGNMLITESVKGRAFEIDPEGKLVWEYFHVVDNGRLALLTEAQRLPSFLTPAFFEEGRRTCGETQAAGVSTRR
jgi:Arylsulfotransferase (ASST)